MTKGDDSSIKKSNYFFILLYVLAIVIMFLLFRPYLTFLLLGVIIVMFFYPVNKWLRQYITNRVLSSLVMTGIVALILLVIAYFIGATITGQAANAYSSLSSLDLNMLSAQINESFGIDIDLVSFAEPALGAVTSYITGALPNVFNSIADIIIRLFLMIFLIYYAFKEGDTLLVNTMALLPIPETHKNHLKDEAERVLRGVMYGQVLVAGIQGFLGGLGFWIFGIPNPVFWGLIMAVLAFIPFLGTPMVWLPASIIELTQGHTGAGIGMLLFGGIIVMNIDNFLKPKIIGNKTGMHPFLVIIGIFGGLELFGIIGMLIGPVVVALCTLAIKYFNQEVKFA